MTEHSIFAGLGHHAPSGGCELTTTSGVYFTDLSLEVVTAKIRDFDLIPVHDGNGTALFLNPMAVTTVRKSMED